VHVGHSIDIDASPERVWSVMTDIERWPDMTESVTKAELTPSGPLAMGSEARITQPRLGTRRWRVTALEPGKSFTWETRGAGVHMAANHTITPTEGGRSSVTLAIHSSGWAVRLFGWLLAGTGRRYMDMEAQGLKRRAEAA
jgi:hypothetical protein